MFGLTYEQTRLMFSTQKMLTSWDIDSTKDEQKKKIKSSWLQEWEKGISTYLDTIDGSQKGELIDSEYLHEAFTNALNDDTNLTWYYIVVLELIAFVPYTPLESENNQLYKKCKYDTTACYNQLKRFIMEQGHITGVKIDRLRDTYNKKISKLSGKTGKIVQSALIAVTITAALAAVAAIFAGPIAVAIFGGAFPGLHGIALTSACLAMLGGGAVAIGGAGIAGGIAVVAGGGALLGLAGGGAIAGVNLLFQSPDFTLTQAAKLETILQEVILNAQHDICSAQKIIAQYREQIGELTKRITILELENKQNKKDLDSIKISLKYMKTSCMDMNVFTSSFEIGENAQK